jgi:Nucleotidyl transferase AbiEii toxin, Type IV TA system
MTNHEAGEWHREVITASTATTLRLLQDAALLDPFYLAGGTGLALRLGHRQSNDLDFFAADLDEESFLQRLQVLPNFALVAKAPRSLHATVAGSRVTFLEYRYPVLFRFSKFQEINVADPRDIACMKVSAIASRGTKRDFVDLYVCAQQFGLGNLLHFFERKYTETHYNKLHLLKSLTFYGDAEKDPMPHMLIPLDWDAVKRFFLGEVPRLFQ